MKQRHGGKFGKKHDTFTEAAAVIADIAHACPHTTRVISGVISIPRGSSGSSRRVKILNEGHALRLSVTANASHQTLYIYAADNMAVRDWMRPRIENEGFKFVDATQQT